MPESLLARSVPTKHTAHRTVNHRLHHALPTEMHLSRCRPHDAHRGNQQAECLQSIRSHDGLNSTTTRVEPDEQQHSNGCKHKGKRTIPQKGCHNKLLQHKTHQIETRRSPRKLAQHEEESTCAMRAWSETRKQI